MISAFGANYISPLNLRPVAQLVTVTANIDAMATLRNLRIFIFFWSRFWAESTSTDGSRKIIILDLPCDPGPPE
jgi:hypothetical protein